MKENVGRTDRIARSLLGPTLMALGYQKWGGRNGDVMGIAAIVAGATVVESAITRVCPLNALFGIDTRSSDEIESDLRNTISTYSEKPIDTERYGIRVAH